MATLGQWQRRQGALGHMDTLSALMLYVYCIQPAFALALAVYIYKGFDRD